VLTGGKAFEERVGIFETPKRLTSELISPLVESYRTLQCTMENVCAIALGSLQKKGKETVESAILGCKTVTQPRYEECSLSLQDDVNKKTDELSQIDALDIQAQCARWVESSLAAERAVLKLAVSYDSGYRSMLQSAGMIEAVSAGAEAKNIRPIQSLVNILGKLHQIPCFISQCDQPLTP
jgi:hypothetical protein